MVQKYIFDKRQLNTPHFHPPVLNFPFYLISRQLSQRAASYKNGGAPTEELSQTWRRASRSLSQPARQPWEMLSSVPPAADGKAEGWSGRRTSPPHRSVFQSQYSNWGRNSLKFTLAWIGSGLSTIKIKFTFDVSGPILLPSTWRHPE